MPFVEIPDSTFDAATDYVVKESKGMNTVIGVVLVFLALLGASFTWVALLFFGIPAIMAFARGAVNKTVMVLNKNGFYYYGDLITNWNNFIDVEFVDEVPLPGPIQRE